MLSARAEQIQFDLMLHAAACSCHFFFKGKEKQFFTPLRNRRTKDTSTLMLLSTKAERREFTGGACCNEGL